AVDALGLDSGRVRVVPLGLDHDELRPPPAGAPREPFLLYPARRWPHKNHARLFEAFALLRAERPELRLVLTGGGAFGSLPDGVGAAARLFDPHDPAAIADAVRTVLDDPQPWIERGLTRAARYSWDETARLTDDVYGELL